ncbi:hypothetical protein ACFVJH_02105 [Streptomyces decoyicus]|uniref:hypothetical protein n=1 Tax=Streptomyces decoyicus TaxID=249567 RepID=UPI003633851C
MSESWCGSVGRGDVVLLGVGITASWATGDEADGQGPHLRTALQTHGVGYVLAVARPRRRGRAAS